MTYLANINPETGVAYGYIAASALHPDVVHALLYDVGVNLTAAEAYKVWRATKADMLLDSDMTLETIEQASAEAETYSHEFWDTYEDYEPTIEGQYEDVTYITSWLGGALNFFISQSPYITDKARLASPCVPNAGILDVLDGSVTSYDVPLSWRCNDAD